MSCDLQLLTRHLGHSWVLDRFWPGRIEPGTFLHEDSERDFSKAKENVRRVRSNSVQ